MVLLVVGLLVGAVVGWCANGVLARRRERASSDPVGLRQGRADAAANRDRGMPFRASHNGPNLPPPGM